MVHNFIFCSDTRKVGMTEDDLSKSQRKSEEGFLPSSEMNEKLNEEEMYNRQFEYLKEQRRGTEGIRLQQKLKDILKGLRSRYRVPYQKTIQKNKTFHEMVQEARSINAYRATTLTFKFFYILSIVIVGFFLHWLYYQFPLHEVDRFFIFTSVTLFLIGLLPIKNVIYLPRPTKSICDTCEDIESFIWKKEIFEEDIIKMKKLRNYGHLLIFLSVLSKVLNFVFIFTVLYVSTSIGISELLPKTLDPILTFLFFIISSIPMIMTIAIKQMCFLTIIEKQYSPEIIRLFL